jgi:sugar phosphate permease
MGSLIGPGRTAYLLLLVVMAVQGLAQATGWATNVAIMTNWTRHRERGRVMAIWATCYQLGAVAAKSFAAFMFAWLGLAWSFWGAGLVLAAVVVLFSFLARESPESIGHPPLEPEPARAEDPLTGLPEDAPADPAVMRRIVTMGLIYFSFKFLRYALDSWSALLASERFGTSTANAGYLSTLFDWVGFVGVMAAGWGSDRLFGGRRSPVIFLMSVGCFVATLLLWKVGMSSMAMFGVFLGAIGFFSMGPDSLLSGAGAMDVGSRKQAVTAAAAINGLGAIGPIFSEPVIGWAKTYRGIDAVLLVLVFITALAAVSTGLFWYVARRQRLAI